jgi:hypothetical protein
MDRNQLIIASIVSFVVFLYSLELTSFSGYTYLGLGFMSIVFYFGYEYILSMIQSGKSVVAIISFLIFGLIVLALFWGGYRIYINKIEINKSWPEYKCRPYIMPFAGWAVGPKGVSATSNFSECLWNTNKSMFDILMTPFRDILNQIIEILSGIVKDIQNIRKMVNYLRGSVEELATDVYKKIWDSYVRIAYLFKAFVRVFEKLGQVFAEMFEVMLYTIYTFGSLFNGVVGKIEDVVHFFCFDGNTSVNMMNGTKKIGKICTNDVLIDNNRVKGVIKFDATNVEMYSYKDIIVSGDHLVMENGKWLRVQDSLSSKRIKKYNGSVIYCLITENSLIKVGDYIFKDYMETNNGYMKSQIYNYILNSLNNNETHDITTHIDLESGIDGNIKMAMNNDKMKKIKDLKIGDITKNGKVLAISKIRSDNVCKYNNMIMTNNIIIYKNNEWRSLLTEENVEKIEYNDDLYHIITDSHIVDIDGLKIRDFEQISDDGVNNIVDNYVLSNLKH